MLDDGQELVAGTRDVPRPIHWPQLTDHERPVEMAALAEWVDKLRERFPNLVRIPDCWKQHNDLVEVLAALRDHERACFFPRGSASGPVEWHRALRDMESRLDAWTKRLPCEVPGRVHT